MTWNFAWILQVVSFPKDNRINIIKQISPNYGTGIKMKYSPRNLLLVEFKGRWLLNLQIHERPETAGWRRFNSRLGPLLLSIWWGVWRGSKPRERNGGVKSWVQDARERRECRLSSWTMCCSPSAERWLAYVRSVGSTLSTFQIRVTSRRNVLSRSSQP